MIVLVCFVSFRLPFRLCSAFCGRNQCCQWVNQKKKIAK